jgi:hypothetical protein
MYAWAALGLKSSFVNNESRKNADCQELITTKSLENQVEYGRRPPSLLERVKYYRWGTSCQGTQRRVEQCH